MTGSRLRRGALLAAALLVVGVTTYKGLRLAPHVRALVARAQSLTRGDPSGLGGLDGLREQLGDTRRDLEAVRAELAPLPWLAERLGWLPGVGPDLAAAPPLLDLGIALCDAGWWALLGLEPAADAASPERLTAGKTALEAMLPALAAARPRFAEAEMAVARARAARERIDARRLSPRLARWVARLDEYLPVLEAALGLAERAPQLLGQERPVTYLVLAQNNQELRPTGGFISGLGVIQLSQGRVITSTFEDSYRVDSGTALQDHPPAPAPLREYMWAPALMFRDANWSPDFPTSAAVAGSIYRLARHGDVDGVVAIDLDAVSGLLGALGPLQPEGYPEPVNSGTLLEYVGRYWTAPLRSETTGKDTGEWWSHRKDFMADLLQAGMQRVIASPQDIDPRQAGTALLEALQGRHLLVYLRDAAAAQALGAAGWDGALRPAAGDYAMLVDANVGFRKVNPNVQQSISYRVEARAGAPARATLVVRYTNTSRGSPPCVAGSHYDDTYEEMMQGCYWDYVRLYVPWGSRLLGVTGGDSAPEASEEAGKAVFSTLLVAAPGETRELAFSYELPAGVASAPAYSLLIQKQPGSADAPVDVGLLGTGWHVAGCPPSAAVGAEGSVRFDLAGDTRLEWVTPAAWPPRTWALVGAGAGLVVALGALKAAGGRSRGPAHLARELGVRLGGRRPKGGD